MSNTSKDVLTIPVSRAFFEAIKGRWTPPVRIKMVDNPISGWDIDLWITYDYCPPVLHDRPRNVLAYLKFVDHWVDAFEDLHNALAAAQLGDLDDIMIV